MDSAETLLKKCSANLIVCDINMVAVDGIEMLRSVCEAYLLEGGFLVWTIKLPRRGTASKARVEYLSQIITQFQLHFPTFSVPSLHWLLANKHERTLFAVKLRS
jgi:hypothetical protein